MTFPPVVPRTDVESARPGEPEDLWKSRSAWTQIFGMTMDQPAGLAAVEVCCRHGPSPAMSCKPRAWYGREVGSDANCVKQVEDETVRCERSLGNPMIRLEKGQVAWRRHCMGILLALKGVR